MMREGDNRPIDGNANVDRFLIGSYKVAKLDRSLDAKQAMLIVAEQLDDGRTGKISLKHIEPLS